jgi:pimeloyl-ACP methyl ester carboxylesterase
VPDRFVLVGTSLGGYVSLEVAHRVPARLLGLVLISTSARGDPPSAAPVRDAFDQRLAAGDLAALAADVTERSIGSGAEAREEVVATVRAMLERVGPEVSLRHSRAARTRPDQRPHLAELTMPALVLAGDEDVVVQTRVTRELAAGLVGATYLELPAAGHVLTLEQPRVVNDALTAFLRALG